MATKDDKPGLLSKVAMFVRNPTQDWSELDQPNDPDGGGYDKQALKAMIERKRQNDFVRKREFDQLRKLRDRDPGAIASMARQSFFQNSMPSDMGVRADTIKKIDEIEAQMSRQWWKSKNGALPPQQSAVPSPHLEATVPPPDLSQSELQPSDSALSAPFAATEPVSLRRSQPGDIADEFIPTQMASDMASVPGDALPKSGREGAEDRFSTSRLFAVESDPELEEGAIRFANSDDAGAESSLLAALRGNAAAAPVSRAWAAALLDLYRVTNNASAFEAASREFALQLEGARPVWFALGEPLPQGGEAAQAASHPLWTCPPVLEAADLQVLRLLMEQRPMPWYLRWGALEQIAPDAIALLDALFSSFCDEAVTLRLEGEERLVRVLRSLTPSGNREVSRSSWQLRLNLLRALGLQDDFELAALDYCVTYELAPPAWVHPRCRVEKVKDPAAAEVQTESPSDTQPQAPGWPKPDAGLVLQGQILGDASLTLSALNAATPMPGHPMVISCRDLLRVDFAAAGSILNWVALRQAEGNEVHFQDVHRLVAAFFNVIGINEHAKVLVRAI